MKLRRILEGSASVLVLLTATTPALAQSQPVETVVVTGIRASLKAAMDIKRDSTSIVDAVSAEDIGKFPDKNIADALQRVPGVNTVSAAGGEGGFDENDRVQIRGTNPSLTDVQVDGHKISTGDWFILDQFGTVGRSVSFTLMPSEIVSNLKVYKSQQADLLEGGVAGVVDIITRKPFDLKDNLTLEATAEAVYTTLRGDVTPQFNGLVGWKDDSGKFGVILQGFYEARNIRRDGQEFLGYSSIGLPSNFQCPTAQTCPPTATVPVDAGSNPALVGAIYPNLIGSAYFLQQRVREGGIVSAQFQPADSIEFDVQAYYSKLKASNENSNFMFWGSHEFGNNTPTTYTLQNGAVVSATFPKLNAAGNNVVPIVADYIKRPGSGSDTYFVNAHASWDATSNFNISVQGGATRGVGKTSPQVAWEGNVSAASTASYTITPEGIATVSVPGVDLSNPANMTNGWAWTVVSTAIDREYYGQIDATWQTKIGPIDSVKAGVRYSDHRHHSLVFNGGVSYYSGSPGQFGTNVMTGTYPSDFADSFKIPGMLTNLPQADTTKIENILFNTCAAGHGCTYTDGWRSYPLTPAAVSNPANGRFDWTSSMDLSEFDTSLYAMATFGGEGWRGNFGVRLANTREDNKPYINDPSGTYSDFGPYSQAQVVHSYWDILPSINININLTEDQYLRFAAAETIARPDYGALGGAVNLTDLILTGTGGNPDLKPVKSANYNLSYEWYYAPQSLVAVSLFYMDLSSYVGFGAHKATYVNQLLTGQGAPVYSVYNVTTPINTSGHTEGVEVQWEQPVYGGFGLQSNFTYADGVDNAGGPLVGDAKVTLNLGAYYENEWLSTRLSYTYRSKMLIGLDRSTQEFQSPGDDLNASVQATLTDNITLTFDALNILNRKLRYTQGTEPRAIYDNGRQLYAGVRLKY
jgi:iron complex outermembrane receptor protein